MAFGAKIKLTVDKSNKSQFRGQIQELVNEATSNKPIKIKDLQIDLQSQMKTQLAKQLSNALADAQFTIKIREIDASSAVNNLRRQLTTMLSGLSITGLKEFVSFGDTDTTRNIKEETAATNEATAALKQRASAAKSAEAASRSAAAQAEAAAVKEANLARQAITLRQQITNYINKNSNAYKAYSAQFDSMLTKLASESGVTKEQLATIRTEFASIKASADAAGISGQTFFERLRAGWEKFGGWSVVTKTLMAVIRTVKNMVNAVKDLDLAMTELQKVTDLTNAGYERFYKTAVKVATEVGAKVSDTINATADFARLGFSVEDATELARAALVYKNVGDGIDNISEATESLISTMKAFGIAADDSMHIVDSFNEVGNRFAISSVGIGDALQRSAAALAAAGNTLEESIGLVTAANNVVQNPDQVGTAMKTISMYLRAAKTEAEEAGISIDGMANSVSELREEILALTGGKVDIMLDDNTFKSTFQILKELSRVWDTLSDASHANIMELIGGKRGGNIVSALITNFKDAENAAKTALNSMGSAAKENEKYLNSIAGKIDVMAGKFENLAYNIIGSDVVKAVVDAASFGLDSLNKITEWFGALPTIVATATAALEVFGKSLGMAKYKNGVLSFLGTDLFSSANGLQFGSMFDTVKYSFSNIGLAFKTFFSSLNSDQKALVRFNRDLNSGVSASDAFTKHMSTASAEAQTMASHIAMGDATLEAYGISAAGAAAKTTMLNIALKATSVLINTAISFGITLLIQGVINLISNIAHAGDAAKEAAEEAAKAAKESSEAVSDSVNEYINLRKALDNNETTQSEFNDSVKDTTFSLAKQGETIDMLIQKYGDLDRAMLNSALIKLNDAENGLISDVNTKKSNLLKTDPASTGNGIQQGRIKIWDENIFSDNQLEKIIASRLKSAGLNVYDFYTQNGGLIGQLLDIKDFDTKSVDGIIRVWQEYGKALDIIKEIKGGTESDFFQSVYGEWSKLDKVITEYKDALKDYYDNVISQGIIKQMLQSGIPKTQEEFDSFRDGIIKNTQATGIMNDQLEAVGFSVDDLVDSALDGYSAFSDFSKGVESTNNALEKTRVKANDLSDILKQAKEGYNLLETAKKEMEENGGISGDTLSAIYSSMKPGEDIQDYLIYQNNLLQLNTEAWEERTKAIISSEADKYANAVADINQELATNTELTDEEIDALKKRKEEYGNMYRTLIFASRMFGSKESEEDPLSTFSSTLSSLKSAGSLYKELVSGDYDLISALQSVTDIAEKSRKSLLDFIEIGEDGSIGFSESGVMSYIDDLCNKLVETEQVSEDTAQKIKKFVITDLKQDSTLSGMKDTLSALKSAGSLYKEINSGDYDIVDTLSSLIDIAGKSKQPLEDFIEIGDDGSISFKTSGLLTYISNLCDELEASGEISHEAAENLKNYVTTAVETGSSLDTLSKALSGLKSAGSLYKDISSSDYDLIDTLSSVIEIAENSERALSDFISVGEDGSIAFNQDALLSYIDSLCEKMVESGEISEESADKLKEYVTAAVAQGSALNAIRDTLSSLKSAGSLYKEINSGDYDIVDTLSSVIEIAEKTNRSLSDFINFGENGEISFNSYSVYQYINDLCDKLVESGEISEEAARQLKGYVITSYEADSTLENLKNTITGLKSAGSLYQDLSSGDYDPIDMLLNVIELAKEGEMALSDFVTFGSDGSIEFKQAGIIAYIDNLCNEMVQSKQISEEAAAKIKEYVTTITEADTFDARMKSFQGAESIGDSITRNTQVTRDTLQSLISTDARYAQAVEYVNGQLTINRDKYNELTDSILKETLAEVEAEAQAIILDERYRDLASRIGHLSDEEQKELDGMNARIMTYAVLANELENATSAYQRFMNSSGDDSKGRYAQAVKALGVITDTIENGESSIYGMIGRDQFKLAVDFVLGENVKVNTEEFDRGLAIVKRYLTEDAEGVTNFYDDLVSNGIIDASTGAMNTTVTEISKTLNISEEAVRAMLEQLERYQEEPFDWEKLDPGSDAEKAKSQIETLQEATENAKQAAQEANDAIDALQNAKIVVDTSAAVNAVGTLSEKLQDIIDKLATIASNSKITIDETVNKNTNGSSGGGLFSGLFGKSAAGGTNSSAGGKTLVGEIAPEILVDPESGTWRTVGNNGPEFVNLKRGSIILNSQQTAKLLGAGRKKSGNAAAGGLWSSITGAFSSAVSAIAGAFSPTKSVSGTVNRPTGNNSNNNNSSGDSSNAAKAAEDLKQKYEELNKELEHLIEHQEFLYKVAERGLDYKGMAASLEEQARLYRKIMENSYKAVEEMKKQGKTDTDEDLQDMERAAWSAYESMYDAFDKIRALYTDSLNDKIDDIQKGYSNLKDILDEIANNGGATVDAFQALTEHGLQYLSFLENADGQYKINTDAIEQMIAAEKEQLAVETALSYISSLKEALNDGQQNRIAALVDATQQISDNTWNAVYAQAALLKDLGLSDDQYNQVIFNIDALRNIAGNVITDLSKQTDDALKSQQDALDKILEFTEDLVQAETKERIKAIEEEVDAYKKIIDLKKEALKVTKDENEYEKSVAEKVQEIAKIQSQIDQLSLDDSRAARAERAKLVEDMAKLQTELSDYQADHAYEAQVDTLDKMSDEYSEKRQTEIDTLEESISSTEKVYRLALDRIRNGWSSLYVDLIGWNTEQGSVINQEITENWNLACEAVEKYGNYLMALQELRGLDVGATGSPAPGYQIVDFNKIYSDKLGVPVDDIQLSGGSAGVKTGNNPAGGKSNIVNANNMNFNPSFSISINHNGNLTDDQARRYGEEIAQSALDKMRAAFERRGVNNVFGAKLKPA